MKIERIESILAGNGHFVRITTDNGVTGIGQSSCWAYLEAVNKLVEKFSAYLVGKDPLQIEHHWQYLYRMESFRGSPYQEQSVRSTSHFGTLKENILMYRYGSCLEARLEIAYGFIFSWVLRCRLTELVQWPEDFATTRNSQRTKASPP